MSRIFPTRGNSLLQSMWVPGPAGQLGQHSMSPTFAIDETGRGGLYDLGDAWVAPTKIYRPHRAWDAPSSAVAFLCRASSS